MDAHLEAILERLCAGDDAAAGQAFLAYEPYLRMVVGRQMSGRLRAKFDSEDIVQSVWVDLLRGFRGGRWSFPDTAHLRAFLVTATRNRFLNRIRQHRHALAAEQSLSEDDAAGRIPSAEPRPSQTAQADDLWERLLESCPPTHRELLRLKREGLPLADIAARTGLHESSVRRILYGLLQRLAVLRGATTPCPAPPGG